jgi:hypothetical protein
MTVASGGTVLAAVPTPLPRPPKPGKPLVGEGSRVGAPAEGGGAPAAAVPAADTPLAAGVGGAVVVAATGGAVAVAAAGGAVVVAATGGAVVPAASGGAVTVGTGAGCVKGAVTAVSLPVPLIFEAPGSVLPAAGTRVVLLLLAAAHRTDAALSHCVFVAPVQ